MCPLGSFQCRGHHRVAVRRSEADNVLGPAYAATLALATKLRPRPTLRAYRDERTTGDAGCLRATAAGAKPAHTELMKSRMVAVLLSGAFTVSTGLPALASHGFGRDGPEHPHLEATHGSGPPPWAQAATKMRHQPAPPAKPKLAAGEHAELMRVLTRRHRVGMQQWSRCRSAGRDECEKPLPPGLAKRR